VNEEDFDVEITSEDLDPLICLVKRRNDLQVELDKKVDIFLTKFSIKKVFSDMTKEEQDEILSYLEKENILNLIKDVFSAAQEVGKQVCFLIQTKTNDLLDRAAIKFLLYLANHREVDKVFQSFISTFIKLRVETVDWVQHKIEKDAETLVVN